MIPGIVAGAPIVKLWTPADLPVAPKIWIDWDSSVTNVSGAASAWSNSKGSIGGTFSQSTSGYRPTILASELNGKQALRFDGTDDNMTATGSGFGDLFRNTNSGWCFTVLKKRGTDGAATSRVAVYAPRGSDGATRFQVAVGSTAAANANGLFVRRVDSDSLSSLNGSTTPGSWIIRCDIMDWSVGDGFIYLNGTLNASNASLTSSGSTTNVAGFSNVLALGMGSVSTPGACADMDIACALISSGSLPSTDNRQRLEGWAAWQLGLEGNLPIDHPYKNDPPIA